MLSGVPTVCSCLSCLYGHLCHVFLQPLRVPGFAFAWLDLMSHRNLMPKLLLAPSHKGWPNFQRLLLALLRFLEPYLRNAELTDAVRLLYKVNTPGFSLCLFICFYDHHVLGVLLLDCARQSCCIAVTLSVMSYTEYFWLTAKHEWTAAVSNCSTTVDDILTCKLLHQHIIGLMI